MYLHKQYLPTTKKNVKIKFSVSFNRETVSWATNQPKKIGYQVTATPVEICERESGYNSEVSGAFTGFNDNLLECNRQSSKRLKEAIQVLQNKLDVYKDFFIKKGYEFEFN